MKSLISELRANRALVLVLVAFTILSATYSFATRLKWGPDEPAHFIYIRSIATDFAPPAISHEVTPTEESTDSHEAHQPPLYYAIMAVPFAALNALGASTELIWRILRLLNIPLGIMWLLGIYALAFGFFKDRARATAVTAIAALIPTSAYTVGVINNENLISPLFTWSLVPMLAYFRSGAISRRSSVCLGLLIGLAILTKAQGLILVVMLLIASLAILRRDSYRNWKPVLTGLGIALETAALVGGWWFVRSWLVNGELMPQSLYNPVFPSGLPSVLVQPGKAIGVALAASYLTYGHFWIPYWLIQPYVPYLDYFYPLCALSAIILVGFGLRIVRNGDLDRRGLAFLLAAPLLVYVLWLRHALFVDVGANMQGRLFLCVAGVVGIVWILGIEGLARNHKARAALTWLAYGILVAANIGVLAAASALYSH